MSEQRTRCVVAHTHGMATMMYSDHVGFVTLSLDAFVDTNKADEHVARFPAFPGRLGIADSRDEALDSLGNVLEEWVTLFLEHNKIESFQEYLIEQCQFQLVPRPFKRATPESEGAEQALLNVPIPERSLGSSAVQ